jgi:hypothetical protein
MIEDPDPKQTPEPFRFEARVGRVDRPPVAIAVVLVAFVLLAIAKPWGGERPSAGAVAPPLRPLRPATAAPTIAKESVAPADDSDGVAAVADFCLEPGSWRTATIETWRDQTVRVWRAVTPVSATGPDDHSIPTVPAVGTSIPAIGYCAPGAGGDQPIGPVSVEAWRLESGGAAPVDLRPIDPNGVDSAFGGLYGPPSAAGLDPAASWADGIIVFRHADAGTGIERWFGIEIRGVSEPSSASPQPSR